MSRWTAPRAELDAIRDEALARAKGAPFVVSISGGKDSTATALWLQLLGIPFCCVHMDTGWEHPDTVRYLREVLPETIGPIEIIAGRLDLKPELLEIAEDLEARYLDDRPSAMVRMLLRKQAFPPRMRRFCTQETKVLPFQRWLTTTHPTGIVSVVGERADESTERLGLEPWSQKATGDKPPVPYWHWRPLLKWTVNEVTGLHRHRGVALNPLYGRGATRVGCAPCIMARKAEIRMLFGELPGRLALLGELEQVLTERARNRNPGASRRTYFHRERAGNSTVHEVYTWACADRAGQLPLWGGS